MRLLPHSTSGNLVEAQAQAVPVPLVAVGRIHSDSATNRVRHRFLRPPLALRRVLRANRCRKIWS